MNRVVEKFHSSINKTASIDRFHEIEADGEFIFQQLEYNKASEFPSQTEIQFKIYGILFLQD